MATEVDAGERAKERGAIPLRRLLARTARLSLPAIFVVLCLFITGQLGLQAAMFGLIGGLLVGGILAHAREKRLVEVERQLQRLMAVSEPADGSFELLGGDALPAMTQQVEQSLMRMRARQNELDRTVSALVDSLPDPLLMILDDKRIERANLAAKSLFERDCAGQVIEGVIRDPGFLAAVDDVLDGSDEAEVRLELAGPPTASTSPSRP
ncbi:MAG: PAS domain-containing protein [Geminicoccaceae bacterium]